MNTLLLLCWVLSGLYLGYKSELIFNYAMHMMYTLTNKVVKNPFKTSYIAMSIPFMFMGPLVVFCVWITSMYIPKEGSFKEAWSAIPGKAYRTETISQSMERWKNRNK